MVSLWPSGEHDSNKAGRHGVGTVAERSYPQAAGRERPSLMKAFVTSKPTPNDMPPPTWPHLVALH